MCVTISVAKSEDAIAPLVAEILEKEIQSELKRSELPVVIKEKPVVAFEVVELVPAA